MISQEAFRILIERTRGCIGEEGSKISDTSYDKFLRTRRFELDFLSFVKLFFPKRIRRPIKDESYYDQGLKKLEKSLDVLTFLRA